MHKLLCLLILFLLPLWAPAEEAAELSLTKWVYPVESIVLYDSGDYLTLTNRESLLDQSYIPGDLETVTVKHVSGTFQLREKANKALEALFAAASEDGYTLYVKSAYRSFATQRTMYNARLNTYGYDDGWVAYPGSSDHQTGLGVDVLNYAWTKKDGMNSQFAKTDEAQWMAAHCAEYGYIIRYMEDKQEITGIHYEPWHLRYVGTAVATYMMGNQLSLEEFTAEYRQYIADFEAQGGSFIETVRIFSQLPPVQELANTGIDGDSEISIFYPCQ